MDEKGNILTFNEFLGMQMPEQVLIIPELYYRTGEELGDLFIELREELKKDFKNQGFKDNVDEVIEEYLDGVKTVIQAGGDQIIFTTNRTVLILGKTVKDTLSDKIMEYTREFFRIQIHPGSLIVEFPEEKEKIKDVITRLIESRLIAQGILFEFVQTVKERLNKIYPEAFFDVAFLATLKVNIEQAQETDKARDVGREELSEFIMKKLPIAGYYLILALREVNGEDAVKDMLPELIKVAKNEMELPEVLKKRIKKKNNQSCLDGGKIQGAAARVDELIKARDKLLSIITNLGDKKKRREFADILNKILGLKRWNRIDESYEELSKIKEIGVKEIVKPERRLTVRKVVEVKSPERIKESIKNVYNRLFASGDMKSPISQYPELGEFILRNLRELTDGIIIDSGGGLGELVEFLREKGCRGQAVVIDLSSVAVKLAREKGLNAVEGDVEHLSRYFESDTADAVILEVLESLPEPRNALMEIKKILKPNGKAVFLFNQPEATHMLQIEWRLESLESNQKLIEAALEVLEAAEDVGKTGAVKELYEKSAKYDIEGALGRTDTLPEEYKIPHKIHNILYEYLKADEQKRYLIKATTHWHLKEIEKINQDYLVTLRTFRGNIRHPDDWKRILKMAGFKIETGEPLGELFFGVAAVDERRQLMENPRKAMKVREGIEAAARPSIVKPSVNPTSKTAAETENCDRVERLYFEDGGKKDSENIAQERRREKCIEELNKENSFTSLVKRYKTITSDLERLDFFWWEVCPKIIYNLKSITITDLQSILGKDSVHGIRWTISGFMDYLPWLGKVRFGSAKISIDKIPSLEPISRDFTEVIKKYDSVKQEDRSLIGSLKDGRIQIVKLIRKTESREKFCQEVYLLKEISSRWKEWGMKGPNPLLSEEVNLLELKGLAEWLNLSDLNVQDATLLGIEYNPNPISLKHPNEKGLSYEEIEESFLFAAENLATLITKAGIIYREIIPLWHRSEGELPDFSLDYDFQIGSILEIQSSLQRPNARLKGIIVDYFPDHLTFIPKKGITVSELYKGLRDQVFQISLLLIDSCEKNNITDKQISKLLKAMVNIYSQVLLDKEIDLGEEFYNQTSKEALEAFKNKEEGRHLGKIGGQISVPLLVELSESCAGEITLALIGAKLKDLGYKKMIADRGIEFGHDGSMEEKINILPAFGIIENTRDGGTRIFSFKTIIDEDCEGGRLSGLKKNPKLNADYFSCSLILGRLWQKWSEAERGWVRRLDFKKKIKYRLPGGISRQAWDIITPIGEKKNLLDIFSEAIIQMETEGYDLTVSITGSAIYFCKSPQAIDWSKRYIRDLDVVLVSLREINNDEKLRLVDRFYYKLKELLEESGFETDGEISDYILTIKNFPLDSDLRELETEPLIHITYGIDEYLKLAWQLKYFPHGNLYIGREENLRVIDEKLSKHSEENLRIEVIKDRINIAKELANKGYYEDACKKLAEIAWLISMCHIRDMIWRAFREGSINRDFYEYVLHILTESTEGGEAR